MIVLPQMIVLPWIAALPQMIVFADAYCPK